MKQGFCTDPAQAEEAAEEYALNRLTGRMLERYEEHLLTCSRCQGLVTEADAFVTSVRTAFAGREETNPSRGKARTRSAAS